MTPASVPAAAPPRTAPVPGPPAQLATVLELGAVATAPRTARAALLATLATWGLSRLADDAEAITAELIANAVAASTVAAAPGSAPAPVWLKVTASASVCRLFIAVWDASPDPPPREQDPGTQAESGRGLMIVAALSARWGWHPDGSGGKVVWAALDTSTPPAPPRRPQTAPRQASQ